MSDASTRPVIFISYAHADEPEKPSDGEVQWLSFVMRFLRPAVKDGVFDLWVDRLKGGADWEAEIEAKLRACDIFILLVSASSMASDYIIDKEIAIIRERQANGEPVYFYPLLLRPIPQAGLAKINDKNLRPRDAKPFSDYSAFNRQQHMTDTANEIAAIAETIAKRKSAAQPEAQPSPRRPGPLRPPPFVDISGLPETGHERLVDRDAELKRLDDAWADRSTNIISLVAEGGAGKSALVNEWLKRMQAGHYRGARTVLGWSFHNQRTNERATAADAFLDWTLEKLRIRLDTTSATAKGEAIAEALAQRRALLVLDGIEPLQHGLGAQQGELKDPGLRALLRRFAAMPPAGAHGLAVLTSRLAVKDIARWKDSTAPVLNAGPLSEDRPPPEIPLPAPSPATQFTYADGQFDLVPSTAWQNRQAQASRYHARALALAAALADRLRNTDAVPDVAASIHALIDFLGENVEQLQPDLLRLASRSITAKARAFGHPGAALEISVESVSILFELADILVDLQAFVRSDLEEHETAIRQLDLTPETAAKAKHALDILTEGILSNPELMSSQAEAVLEAAVLLSDSASDHRVQVAIEGDRILVTSNLALAVARELGRADAGSINNVKSRETGDSGSKPSGQARRSAQKRKAKTPAFNERSSGDFVDRILARIQKKGPDAIGDAVIQAAVSTIKHAPKTIAGLGALFVLWPALDPIILSGGTIASILAWIGFQLRHGKSAK